MSDYEFSFSLPPECLLEDVAAGDKIQAYLDTLAETVALHCELDEETASSYVLEELESLAVFEDYPALPVSKLDQKACDVWYQFALKEDVAGKILTSAFNEFFE